MIQIISYVQVYGSYRRVECSKNTDTMYTGVLDVASAAQNIMKMYITSVLYWKIQQVLIIIAGEVE
ncbi:hypothetical protein PITCH_A310002 [uncultured Desulfobacterium sp.]|uniref:Uncharacterized protein n=1 Tax=uncultured Desulfobacterium sp. TaxID=201089 RepID=A0A445MYY3_9BACT|nr:hypothetical protein PITCH_A310002 [uncultured Desulfobacterium sp.]